MHQIRFFFESIPILDSEPTGSEMKPNGIGWIRNGTELDLKRLESRTEMDLKL